MITSLPSNIRWQQVSKPALACLLFYIAILCYAMHDHAMWRSLNVWLGIIALPLLAELRPTAKPSYRYGWAALLMTVLCIWLPVKTLLFLTVGFAMLFVLESFWGRTNLLLLAVVGMLSPFFQYMANVFSFPVRLWLSGVAGRLLQAMGTDTVVKGNVISQGDREFSVDPACMGLNMLVTSLLLQVLLVAVYGQQQQKTIRWWQLIGLLTFVIGLNIIGNLMRIICLVQFNILPGTDMHEWVGILSLLVYVVLPAVFVTAWVMKKWAIARVQPAVESRPAISGRLIALHVLLAVGVLLAARLSMRHDVVNNNLAGTVPTAAGYQVNRLDGNVIKLQDKTSLIYVKPIAGFYSSDHHPMICWVGSGYEFKQVEAQQVNGMYLYKGILQSGNDQLYTAWWYDNGTNQTTDQIEWRWDALKNGKQYAVINVTAESQEKLEEAIRQIQQQRLSRKILQQL